MLSKSALVPTAVVWSLLVAARQAGFVSTTAAVAMGTLGAAMTLFVLPRVQWPTGCRHLRPFRNGHAPSRVQRVYSHSAIALGVPPTGLVAALCRSEFLAGPCWSLLYETLLAHSRVDRRAKEVVAAQVARSGKCHYCEELHDRLKRVAPTPETDGTDALLSITDENALMLWVRTTMPPSTGAPALAPFTQAQAPELIGVLLQSHFMNRIADSFVDGIPMEKLPGLLRRIADSFITRKLRDSTRIACTPGASFDVLSTSDPAFGSSNVAVERAEEELPPQLRRVLTPNPNVLLAAEVWSRSCARAVRAALRKESRDIIRNFAAAWDGAEHRTTTWAVNLATDSPHEGDRLLLHLGLLVVAGPSLATDAEFKAAVSARGEEAVLHVVAFAAAEVSKAIAQRACARLSYSQ
jgi:hypothetical protein